MKKALVLVLTVVFIFSMAIATFADRSVDPKKTETLTKLDALKGLKEYEKQLVKNNYIGETNNFIYFNNISSATLPQIAKYDKQKSKIIYSNQNIKGLGVFKDGNKIYGILGYKYNSSVNDTNSLVLLNENLVVVKNFGNGVDIESNNIANNTYLVHYYNAGSYQLDLIQYKNGILNSKKLLNHCLDYELFGNKIYFTRTDLNEIDAEPVGTLHEVMLNIYDTKGQYISGHKQLTTFDVYNLQMDNGVIYYQNAIDDALYNAANPNVKLLSNESWNKLFVMNGIVYTSISSNDNLTGRLLVKNLKTGEAKISKAEYPTIQNMKEFFNGKYFVLETKQGIEYTTPTELLKSIKDFEKVKK